MDVGCGDDEEDDAVVQRPCCVCREPVHDHGMQCSRCRVGDYSHMEGTRDVRGLPASPLEDTGMDLLEKDVQPACITTLHLLGWKVYRIGQRNAQGTQDPGPSDLLCLKPGAGVLFVECKRSSGGVQSKAQKAFEADCVAADARYILTNDPHALFAALVEMKQ